jgi:hypothetical protein
MLAVFGLRLAAGMLACLLLLPRRQIHPRFYRTHFLTALGLATLALAFAWDGATDWTTGLLVAGVALAFAGSVVWFVEGAPGGQILVVLATLSLGGGLGLLEVGRDPSLPPGLVLLGSMTSAALLGTALSAMLMGHSYLISPSMSLTPLLRLLLALGVALGVRLLAAAYGWWRWSERHSFAHAGNDVLLWLPVRWLVGLGAPAVLGWMALESARIRSTQSATGILYVVVIFCFLGELTSLLLRESGFPL